MKHPTILFSILAIAACGGSKPPPAEPKEPEPEPPAPEAKPAPEPEPPPAPEPPPPPPPKVVHAQAQLAPVKGVKIKGATVTFSQQEGEAVSLGSTGWFDGLKPGKYHLIVHDGAECGANAGKAGKPMFGADVPFMAAKGTAALEVGQIASIQLDGDAAVIGHTLVLHDDKKGRPGKALACGAIAGGE